MSNNIIDKIQLSGVTYDIGGQGGSGVSVVEVTQAEYDALPTSAKTDTSKMYVITDAEAGDLTNYYTKTETNTLLGGKADTATTYTKTEVDNAITSATSTKQDTLVSSENIKTINNESILGSGNITIQGGGTDTGTVQTMIDQSISGKADSSTVAALTNTVTGHTADTSIHVTTAQTAAWNAKSDFSGSYNDLTDKPTIPTVPTSNTAFTNDAGYLVANDISGKTDVTAFTAHTSDTDIHVTSAEKTSWNAKSDFSGSYNDLTNKLSAGTNITIVDNVISATGGGGGGTVSSAVTSGDTNAVAGGAVFNAVVYSAITYNTELTFDANGYAENWIVGQSAITIDVSGYTSDTRANYHFENSDGRVLGIASIQKTIGSWGSHWTNNADNCTITTDGDTATTATITDIPSGTVKVRRRGENNPPKAIISGDTPEIWIKDALDDHRDNTTIHITAAERTSWNNKSNFSGSYNDLTDKPIPDSALNVASTNPVQNQALYSELRIDNESGETETTLVFDGYRTTNYPQGCTKIKIEGITSNSMNSIHFQDDSGHDVGNITVGNWGSISVDTTYFQGASYEISGTTVIISYPTVTTVTKFDVLDNPKYTYKAITTSTTPLKDQVVANTTALGGLSLVKLTQAQYDALVTKDSNTLYVIVN